MRTYLGIFAIALIILGLIILKTQFRNATLPHSMPTNQIIKSDPVVVAAGDIACGFTSTNPTECQQVRTADLILNQNPNAVLSLGDLQYNSGKLSDFKNYYDKSWGKFKNLTYPTLGNHEYGDNTQGYFDYFTILNKQAYYSFELGQWHIIALDSNQPNSGQLDWLQQDLRAHPTACALAFFHHPFFSSGMHGPNAFVKPIWDILYKNKVDLVLNGHDHLYERFAPQNPEGQLDQNGIRQFTVGTGGRNLYGFTNNSQNSEAKNNQNFGVLKLVLRKDNYDFEFLSINPTTFMDAGTASCH